MITISSIKGTIVLIVPPMSNSSRVSLVFFPAKAVRPLLLFLNSFKISEFSRIDVDFNTESQIRDRTRDT